MLRSVAYDGHKIVLERLYGELGVYKVPNINLNVFRVRLK